MSKYNYMEIGDRIRSERKKLGLSQENLIDTIKDKGKPTCGRNILSGLENGDKSAFNGISLDKMLALCEELGCSLSYLLGEYSCKNYDTEFIHQTIGLSEIAIDSLINWSKNSKYDDHGHAWARNSIHALDDLIKEDIWFTHDILCQIADYCYYRHSYETYTTEDKSLSDKEHLFFSNPEDRPFSKEDRANLTDSKKNYELALFDATRGLIKCIEDIYKTNYLDK